LQPDSEGAVRHLFSKTAMPHSREYGIAALEIELLKTFNSLCNN
jgi:hypothetical protein